MPFNNCVPAMMYLFTNTYRTCPLWNRICSFDFYTDDNIYCHRSTSSNPVRVLWIDTCSRYYVPKAFLPLIITLGGALQRQLCVKDASGVVQTPLCQDPVYTMTQVALVFFEILNPRKGNGFDTSVHTQAFSYDKYILSKGWGQRGTQRSVIEDSVTGQGGTAGRSWNHELRHTRHGRTLNFSSPGSAFASMFRKWFRV